ncbi:hypothetical protein G6O69_35545 [Pseudenhygromyxa sp. WMMC2535]|uniref:hypothetical protein n=1 Tax=Pseudenhygromyxa sp. WMMC2535 TaxID=2712867 RepID=UPI001557019D|nr:hypothetical protein [Pseudenhygromyxa sp. WMMC2535]NVB43193.1 hypothetical protein [Pseudenhygromyxa sp. WMMC2535]
MNDLSLEEPTRLIDDPAVDRRLRSDLEHAREHAPLSYSVDAGLSRFEQAVAGASTVPPGGSLTGIRALGWFTGATALLGFGLLALWLTKDEPAHMRADAGADSGTAMAAATSSELDEHAEPADTRGPDQKIRDEGASVAVPAPSVAGEAIAGESVAEARLRDGAGDAGDTPDMVVADAGGNSPAPNASAPPRPSSKSRQPSPTDPEPLALDEARQINAARRALSEDPARALAITEAAELAFPEGALIQERRGYAILALAALDRHAEARARARDYLARWPQGSLSRRVREAVGEAGEAAGE